MRNAPSRADWRALGLESSSVKIRGFTEDRSLATLNLFEFFFLHLFLNNFQCGYTPTGCLPQASSRSPLHARLGTAKLTPLPAGVFRGIFSGIMPADRYFLDPNGAVTRRTPSQPGDGHTEIGRELLAQRGIVPKDIDDVYRQMYLLCFVRIVEHDDNLTVEVEHGTDPTAAQEQAVEQFRQAGKRIVQKRTKTV